MSTTDLTEEEVKQLEQLQAAIESDDYYAVLGVDLEVNEKELQERYYEMSRAWHPDRHFRRNLGAFDGKLQQIFIFINKAYKTLSDKDQRRRYNRDHRKLIDAKREEASAASKPKTEAPKEKKRRPRREERSERSSGKSQKRTSEDREERKKRRELRKARSEDEPRKRRRPQDARARAIRKLRSEAKGRNNRAKEYFDQGKSEYEAGNPTKAASSLHLAVQFEPDNTEFKALYEKVRLEANESLAQAAMTAGESAENFRNFQEALHYYTKAISYGPANGEVYFRFAMLVKQLEGDNRKALENLRTAVKKTPRQITFRLELGDLYAEMGMGLNARREYQAVLKLDKGNQRAKSGLKSVR